MNTIELYLKTLFCCSACDGDIAQEEIELVKNLVTNIDSLNHGDTEKLLNEYVVAINSQGKRFLSQYLSEIKNAELSNEEQMKIIDLAIKMIEADNKIEYSEIKFFKKIRTRLSISDDEILAKHPDKEDFLLPDIKVFDDPEWDESISFDMIHFNDTMH